MEKDSLPEQGESGSPAPPHAPEGSQPSPAFQTPAEYYSTPPETNPAKKLPRWVPLGCGGAGCLFLLFMVAGAAFVGNQGATRLLSWMFQQMETETMQMVAADVPAAQKEQLRQEFETLTAKLEKEEIGLVSVQPILQELRTAIGDQTLTREEVESLIESLRKTNASSKPAASPSP